jgi:FMN phosphatase YigB (HAD superfamily)
VLDWFAPLRVLSLDCFDTLLWRDCHAPTDLFAGLPDINASQRVHGERRARQLAHAGRGVHDIAIDTIYRTIMPRARADERAQAIAAELDAEARHCYGFAPVIALMREARRRGMQVIVVSDTYLNPRQLHDLIARAAGAEAAALIDRVFCSSIHGLPKAAGLYGEVLARIKARPQQILHIGDNESADCGGVRPFGVHALHLEQFTDRTRQQLRLESAVAALLCGHGARKAQAPQPHRPALAMDMPRMADGAQQLGFATLGPVLFGYDRWLRAEAAALQTARSGTVHWLFLMRDGYLPMRMHRELGAAPSIHAIEISRLTATFATFANDAAIARHVEENRGIDPALIARQLRLPQATVDQLCAGRTAEEGWSALMQWCRVPANRRPIVAAARGLAERLVEHVRATVQPAPGDTLMLVDLGYNGSVQSLIDPLLTRALDVHIAGRYLILRELARSGLDKRGYLGEAHYDHVVLNAMTANVALIEQVCTTATGSVIDYADDGAPVRGSNDIGERQSTVREAVQQGCLAFAGAATAHVQRANPGDRVALWREANAATLMRLMYLPLREELAVVEQFEHDVNLGTGETLALFDPAIAREGLLQQGLFYQKGVRRMFLPAELAEQGFATRLTHLATACRHMPLLAADFAGEAGRIPVILSDARDATRVELPYRATHDGFFALCIPVGAGRFLAAVQFGAIATHVEVHAIVAMPTDEYLNNRHDTAGRESTIVPQFEGITPLTDRLWRCPDASGFAILQPPPVADAANHVIVVVFRPIG